MSAAILEYARARQPGFQEIPDDELTQYIGERHPEFLKDPEFAKVYGMRKEQEANTAAGEQATKPAAVVSDALDIPSWKSALIDGGVGDWLKAAKTGAYNIHEQVAGPVRAATTAVGGLLNAAGELASQDVRNVLGAAGDTSLNLPLPTAVDQSGPVATGLAEAGRMAPTLAAAGALEAVGVPLPLAFGLPTGAETFQKTGDLSAAIEAGSVAAVIPSVMQAGKIATAKITGKLVERGIVPADAVGTQKFAEMLGGQGAVQAFLEGINLPQYAAMSPEDRKRMIIQNAIANTAFMAFDIPGLADGSPSETSRQMSPGARFGAAMAEMVKDPEILDSLKGVVDSAVDPVRQGVRDNPLTPEPPQDPAAGAAPEPAVAEGSSDPRPATPELKSEMAPEMPSADAEVAPAPKSAKARNPRTEPNPDGTPLKVGDSGQNDAGVKWVARNENWRGRNRIARQYEEFKGLRVGDRFDFDSPESGRFDVIGREGDQAIPLDNREYYVSGITANGGIGLRWRAKVPRTAETPKTAVDPGMETKSPVADSTVAPEADPVAAPATEPPEAPAEAGTGVEATVGNAYPGGPLGEAPAAPADNPGFTAFPMEMPEAVRFARDLAGGVYPKLRERIGALGGRALGVFRHQDAAGKASIEMRRDVFDLPPGERARLMEEAVTYAKAAAESPAEVESITRERYDFLKREEFKKNPAVALKVLWHEIGHWVDWVPDHMISGRGNLFGRLASLKDYLRHTIPEGPDVPDRPITPAESAKIRKQAEADLREEMGPIQEIVRTILVEEPEYRVSGVGPEDVKQLLGMDAREKQPELYRWFAEQPAAVKKDILRAAMKGVVDGRLEALGKREQIGTKKTERTVREKVGREPTLEEIRARFRQNLREELKRRRMAELSAVKVEIEPMIAWWRGTKKMEDYFKPSAEMYAEAFSIFANNPAAMAKRAPTYFKILTNYMDRKPEVAKLYRDIQNSLNAGTIMRDRVQDLRSSWAKDDRESMERAANRNRRGWREYVDDVLYHIDDRLGPVYQVARRAKEKGAGIREAAGNYRYRAAEHERLLSRVNREVVEPLWNSGIDRDSLAEYMFHKHVTESRFTRNDSGELVMLGNPMGWTPKNSLDRLAEMKQQMGDQGFARLEAAQKRFREIYQEQVVDLLARSGMASPELMKAINDRVFYATFSKVKGEAARDGIEALLQDSFGPEVGARIYRQVGNLGEIKNPFTATVAKAMSLTSAAHRNILKRETVRAMLEHDSGNIKPADVRWTGKRMEPRIVDQGKVGTIVYLENGKTQAYYVPRAVADALQGGPGVDNLLALAAMRAMGGFKALFTQLNYGFWPVAFVRDAQAWTMQMPKAGVSDYAKHIGPAVKAAYDGLNGARPNRLADEALRRRMVISRADPQGVMSSVDNEFDLAVASYGLDPVKWGEAGTKGSSLMRAWNAYREFGQVAERAQKIAGMSYLDEKFPDMPEWQKAEIVRERAGSPDFLRKGASAPYLDWAMMFFNPWKEGVRSVAKTARENPFSFGAKSLGAIVAPTVLQSLAANGQLGEDAKRLYGSVSDYDLTNYLVVPLGWADRERKKVAYVRLPLWEPARLLHGALFGALTGRGRGFLSNAGGQVPGINPMLTTSAMWWKYLVDGKNPYDSFRGRELLSKDVFEAGGAPAIQELLRQTWNNLGGGIITQFQDRPIGEPDPGRVEAFLRLPGISNLVGRWVKVSNRGIADQDRKAAEPASKDAAMRREGVRQIVEKMMATPPEPLTESERVLMRNPQAQSFYWEMKSKAQASRNSLNAQRLQRFPSKAEKAAVMQRQP